MNFYRLSGTDLPTTPLTMPPYFHAIASEVTFGAEKKSLHFTADHIQANLDHKRVLKEGL
jgi:hypothetical protein